MIDIPWKLLKWLVFGVLLVCPIIGLAALLIGGYFELATIVNVGIYLLVIGIASWILLLILGAHNG